MVCEDTVNKSLEFDISDSATATLDPIACRIIFIGSFAPVTALYASLSMQQVFPEIAGPETFHVYAKSSEVAASEDTKVMNPSIPAVIYPKQI